MIDPNTSSTQLTAMETYAQNAPDEYMIPPGGQPAMEMPEYQNGVVPLDTLPAAWWNWLLYTITEQEKRMVRFFNSIFTEFRNLLTTGGIPSFDETVTNQLVTAIQTIARTPATTLLCGAIKAGTSYGTLAVDSTTGVATVNGAGSGQFNTLAQNITDAINELDGDIGTETNNRTSADNVLQNNIDGKAPISHATTTTTYGKGDDTNYGHVKLSDAYNDGTSDKDAGTAVTPKALKDGLDSIMAIQANVPTGSVFPFAASTAPTGYLICDGRPVDRTTYANLFAVIGVTWGAGDGISTFNIPNLQGRAVMGADTTNTFGSVQADQNKSHSHFVSVGDAGVAGCAAVQAGPGSLNLATIQILNGTQISYYHSHGATCSDDGGTEARPKNLRMNWIIKY